MATESFSHCRLRLGVCVRMMLSAAFVGGRRCVGKHIKISSFHFHHFPTHCELRLIATWGDSVSGIRA